MEIHKNSELGSNDLEDLIFDLIFSKNIEYKIVVSKYIVDIYKYDRFILDMKIILKRAKVFIVKEKVILDVDSVIWQLKVRK